MKTLHGLFWASAFLDVCFASLKAPLYFSKSSRPQDNSQPQSISSKAARLLFAQRLGLSQYHNLGDAEESTLQILNDFGGRRDELFEEGDDSGTKTNIYVVEGVERPQDIIDEANSVQLFIQDPPHAVHNAKLVKDLATQTRHCGATRHDSSIQHLTQLEGISSKDGDRYLSAVESIKSILSQVPVNSDVVTILMPPQVSKPKTKSSPYGIYSMPSHGSHHRSSQPHKRQQEEPLEAPPSPPGKPISHLPAWLSDSDSDTPDEPSSDTNTTAPTPLPHGVLPICYKSEELAVSETNNCSGHGTVYLRAESKDPNTVPDCYACKCGTSKVDIKGKKQKTVHWGGGACQKKDVSGPFWLLAGVTVALIGIIAWGIGLLMSVGNEDLPGVIAAGVAGPSAGK